MPHDTRTLLQRANSDWNERNGTAHSATCIAICSGLPRKILTARLQIAGHGRWRGPERGKFPAQVLSEQNDDRLLIINFGRRHRLVPAPEPLLAPPSGCEWELLWSSSRALRRAGNSRYRDDDEWIFGQRKPLVLRPRLRTNRKNRRNARSDATHSST